MIIDEIERRLQPFGLMTRGSFHPDTDDGVPAGIGTLVLVGNAGPGLWRCFSEQIKTGPHPLDTWTRKVLNGIAAEVGAEPLYPFTGPPYHPFQRWAMRADDVSPSPIGPLIHPEYGLWHAYRGAFAFADVLELPEIAGRPSPCESCIGRPCLSTCPVAAFTDGGYDVSACRQHIAKPDGVDCLETGCRARRACPVGRGYTYAPGQATFHMRHFLNPGD